MKRNRISLTILSLVGTVIGYTLLCFSVPFIVLFIAFLLSFISPFFLLKGLFEILEDTESKNIDKPSEEHISSSAYSPYVNSYQRVVDLSGRDVADLFNLGNCPAQIRSIRLRDMTGS